MAAFLFAVSGDLVFTDRQACHLHEGANHPLAGAFTTLGKIRGKLNFLGDCFRVFIQEQVKKIRADFVFVVSGTNRNRQSVQSAVKRCRNAKDRLGELANLFFLEGKFGAFRGGRGSDFTGLNVQGDILVAPANHKTFFLSRENGRGVEALENTIRVRTDGESASGLVQIFTGQSLEDRIESNSQALWKSGVRNVGVCPSVGFAFESSAITLVEIGADFESLSSHFVSR